MNSNFALKPESVGLVSAASKSDILGSLAAIFARAWDLDETLVLEQLQERENLGSTGFGRGIAIPHARLSGIARPLAAVLKLKKAADFGSADGLPVDLVFGLLSPENCGATHLHALAEISRLARDERMHEALTDAPDAEALYALLSNATDRDAA